MAIVKSSFLFVLFALCARVIATPPACLLAAVNTEEDPADLATICGDDASKVQQVIASICDDNADAAQSAFSSTCAGAGKTVSSYTASPTSTGYSNDTAVMTYTTQSYDSSCSCTKTATIMTTAAAAGSGMASSVRANGTAVATGSSGPVQSDSAQSASSTGPSVAQSTNGASSQGFGSVAAAVIAVAGVVAVL